MAITIYDEPQKYSPSGNPLVFTFSSDETAQDNFSFIVEVYVEGSLHSTHQVFRQFNTLSKFDCSGILSSTLESPLIVDGSLTTTYDSAINEYYIKVYEKYGATPTIQASATSSTVNAFNGSLRHQDWINFDYQEYNADSTSPEIPVKFMTYWPRARRFFCGLDERVFLGILCDDSSIYLRVRLYDSSGSQIVNTVVSAVLNNFIIFDASPSTIIANTTITQIDFDSAAYYTIEAGQLLLIPPVFTPATEEFRIDIDLECKRYATNRLHWLNKFGVWDSFTFTLVSVTSSSVDSFGYSREKGVWNGTSYTYPLYQGESVQYAKRSKDQLVLNSDWIKEDVQQWLVRSLLESPIVYLEQSNGFEPVNINNATYQFKQKRKDGLIQEQITIDRTYSFTSQLN